ncbi:MraY family glycosyltransferase [Bacillus carboniphilus]|uniref:MraY family glycosyltransferase n=1 Tax=Bacillus carboniphilus TaxID=86663 RepID=A0ABY9JQ32_9BACI|nr:MraY family glycosyltransferase [Bacillus carboniphilus]WLR41509.1 MraY family glycosyltransferase [Bacillus carboniphilus]
MYSLADYITAFIISLTVSIIVTPFVMKFARRFGFIDHPNYRKVHSRVMPRLGGASIVIGTLSGLLYLHELIIHLWPMIIGASIILLVGTLDDKYTLNAKTKFIGQLSASCIVSLSGITIDFITLPFSSERIYLGIFSYILTIVWIVGITNSINLIDGLDGLASGVSIIAMTSILCLATLNSQFLIISLTTILIGSTLGFLIYNFYPAKIFMGDTGSLFLGYCISIISLLGLYKSVTIFSLVIPIIVLAIPIFDTFFAILRRLLNKQKILDPDKSHLHHRLLQLGFSHKQTVLIIYAIGTFFGISAIIFSRSTLWGSFIFVVFLTFTIQITAELIGLIGKHQPLLTMFKKLKD